MVTGIKTQVGKVADYTLQHSWTTAERDLDIGRGRERNTSKRERLGKKSEKRHRRELKGKGEQESATG